MEYLEALGPLPSLLYFRLWRNGRFKNVPTRDYEIGKLTYYSAAVWKAGHRNPDTTCGLFEMEFWKSRRFSYFKRRRRGELVLNGLPVRSSIQTAFIDCDVSSLPGTSSKPAGKTDLTGRFVHLPRLRLPTVSRYRFSLSPSRTATVPHSGEIVERII